MVSRFRFEVEKTTIRRRHRVWFVINDQRVCITNKSWFLWRADWIAEVLNEATLPALTAAARVASEAAISQLERLGYLSTPEMRAVVDASKNVIHSWRSEPVDSKHRTVLDLEMLMIAVDDLETIEYQKCDEKGSRT